MRGNEVEKPTQTTDIHIGSFSAEAPLSRTKEPFSEVPFLLSVRCKKRKNNRISSFCKKFVRFPEPKAESSSRQARGSTKGNGAEKRAVLRGSSASAPTHPRPAANRQQLPPGLRRVIPLRKPNNSIRAATMIKSVFLFS